jgi:hypothetical protein
MAVSAEGTTTLVFSDQIGWVPALGRKDRKGR